MGRMVRQLDSGLAAAGQHSTTWDLRLQDGERAPRGIYFLRLSAAGQMFTRNISITH